jgi:uncharacterized repeat protein (TIGR03803 family)
MNSAGDLFGTTQSGGTYGGGALYKLAAGSWTGSVLHNFCASANCADGTVGAGRLLIDASGNLFGETSFGGAYGGSACSGGNPPGCGVVFEHTAGGSYKVLYNFCAKSPHCSDGAKPYYTGLTMDASGNLYGLTEKGGDHNGVLFELANGTWSEAVLHTFCSKSNCIDGRYPEGTLLRDASGNLYGATIGGGQNCDFGTLFELTQ